MPAAPQTPQIIHWTGYRAWKGLGTKRLGGNSSRAFCSARDREICVARSQAVGVAGDQPQPGPLLL